MTPYDWEAFCLYLCVSHDFQPVMKHLTEWKRGRIYVALRGHQPAIKEWHGLAERRERPESRNMASVSRTHG